MMVFAKSYFYLFLQFLLLFKQVTSTIDIQKPKEGYLGLHKQVQLFYFNQKVNHDSNDTQYFRQRYLVYNYANYIAGNPVYFLVEYVNEISYNNAKSKYWKLITYETQGLLLVLEHRMYGYSYIENGRDNTMDNLLYLNTKQALADLAYFREEIFRNHPKITFDAKWVALGSEYGGTLAAILRSKYPNEIEAAVTINARLLATVENKDFYINVEYEYKKADVGDTIKIAFDELKRNFNSCATKEHKLNCVENLIKSQYKDIFILCSSSLSTDYDVNDHITFLYWSLTTILARGLQLGKSEKNDVIKILRDKNNKPNALERLGAAIRLVLNAIAVKCIVNDYGRLINIYKNTSIAAEAKLNVILIVGLGYRQRLYQQCSERGQFETAYKNDGIFANLIPIDFYINVCKRVFVNDFSQKYLERATKTYNQVYGGQEINVSQVIFIKCYHDLWRNLFYSGQLGKNYGIFINNEQYIIPREWNKIFDKLKYYLGIGIYNTENRYIQKNGQVRVWKKKTKLG